MIDRPADNLKIVALGFGDHSGSNKVAANAKLAGADFKRALDWFFELAVIEQASHQSRLGAAHGGDKRGVERNNDGAGDFPGFTECADKGMFAAPKAAGLQFQIENNIMALRKLENFFER